MLRFVGTLKIIFAVMEIFVTWALQNVKLRSRVAHGGAIGSIKTPVCHAQCHALPCSAVPSISETQ